MNMKVFLIGVIIRLDDEETKWIIANRRDYTDQEINEAIEFQEKFFPFSISEVTMDRILIVDGHNLLFQMFFGMPNVIINKDGKMIQGTLGFVGALLKIIDMVTPTHILVLFDSEKEK